MDKLADIKVRTQYRDMLKEHCKENGMKMYKVVENLIEKNCKPKKIKKKYFKRIFNNI
jgi:hypothetical protein